MKPRRRWHALLLPLLAAGCTRVSNDMADQPRYDPATSSPAFADQQATRPPVPGTVAHARGDVAAMSSGRAAPTDEVAAAAQPPDSEGLRLRGHERYEIYCLPCHGARGAGDGEVVRRGFPAPPPFAGAALRATPDAQLYAVILHGSGRMYPFADRVSPADAWAIVAYLRVLQRGSATAGAAPPATGASR
jgi:mono/diheme cytochrome c family protein